MMYITNIYTTSLKCTCGHKEYIDENTRGGVAYLAYHHARTHLPARIVDRRSCSAYCVNAVDRHENADVELWHHKDCFNHIDPCCAGGVLVEKRN